MKKYTWLLVAVFFAFVTLIIFWPFFTGLQPWRVDHPVHQALTHHFIKQIKGGFFPYGDFPHELGGYPFPTYGYELGYWIAAFFHVVLKVSEDYAYRMMVFLLYALSVVGPATWASYKKGPLVGLWIGTAIFSSLIFLQLTAFGMYHFVFAWAVLFYVFTEKRHRLHFALPALFLLSLAHPFALAMAMVYMLVQSLLRETKKNTLILSAGMMVICLPKIIGAFYGMGWLKSSRQTISWGGVAKSLVDVYEHTFLPVITGGHLPTTTWLDFSVEMLRILPMIGVVTAALYYVRSFAPVQKVTVILGSFLAVISSVLWTQQTFLFPERMASFAVAALLAGVVQSDIRLIFSKPIKYGFTFFMLLSIGLTVQLSSNHRAFHDHAATAVIEKSVRAICDRPDVRQDDRRMWFESLYDHPVWGSLAGSNWLAHAHEWCHRGTFGTWSGDWPFPQWPIFSSRFGVMFGFAQSEAKKDMVQGMSDIWNIGWFVTHSQKTKNKFLELNIPLVAEVEGFSLWKIEAPSRWLEASDPSVEIKIIHQHDLEFEFESKSRVSYQLRVSRAYHPFYQATIKENKLPIKASVLFQPVVNIPAGHHLVKLGTP